MLILFDIDDTIIDHSAAVREAVGVLHDQVHPTEDLSTFYASWTAAMKTYFPRFLLGEMTYQDQRRARIRRTVDSSLSDAQADELFDVYFRVYETKWSLFPDVIPCLAQLSGHRVGIISNGNGAEQRSKLERTGVTDRFEFVHISDECGFAKPAAGIFHRACTMAGVAPDDAVYVGDLYEIDAIGSRNAGLHGVFLNRQGLSDREYAAPTIRGLSELSGVLERIDRARRTDGVTFRRATNRDCEAATRVVDGALREYGLHAILDGADVDLTDIDTYYNARGGHFELLEDSAGDVLGVLAWKSGGDGVVELKKLYLVPKARGRGFGRRALTRVVDSARAAGARTVVLETAAALKEANQLYTRFGFVQASGADACSFSTLSEQCDLAYRLDLSE